LKNYDIAVVGSGFIGSSVAKHLKDSYLVRTFGRSKQPDWLQKYNIQHTICDVRNFEQLYKAIENPKIIINTAILNIPKTNKNTEEAYQVNVLGTQNVCNITAKNPAIKGMILTSSMGVLGEVFNENITEESPYHPEDSEDFAIPYYTTKVLQECTVNYYRRINPRKFFGIVRFDSVIGERRKEGIVVNVFIEQALKGNELTPFLHSVNRPLSFISIKDICKSIEAYVNLIINGKNNELINMPNLVNLSYPLPLSVLELANIVIESVTKLSNGKIRPKMRIVDKGVKSKFNESDKTKVKFDMSLAQKWFGISNFISPREEIEKIIEKRLNSTILINQLTEKN